MPADAAPPETYNPENSGLLDWLTGHPARGGGAAAAPSTLPLYAAGVETVPELGLDDPTDPWVIPGMARLAAVSPRVVARPPRPSLDGGWELTRMEVPHNPTDPPDGRSYRFIVRNGSATDALDCLVEFALPVGCRGVRAVRGPRRTRTGLEWNLGVLAPGTSVSLSVRFPLTAAARALAIVPAVVRVATRLMPVGLV